MYRLEVLFPDEPKPRHTEEIEHASDVLARISVLLENHGGCDQIMVYADYVRLFAVDSKGDTMPAKAK